MFDPPEYPTHRAAPCALMAQEHRAQRRRQGQRIDAEMSMATLIVTANCRNSVPETPE
jgi:hypothetical protein